MIFVPKNNGFTLSELLIALTILAVIATFTIPKVLASQQSTTYRAIGKEAIAMVSAAYAAYQQSNSVGATTKAIDLLPYLNYVSILDTTYSFDEVQGQGTTQCKAVADTSGPRCLRLHNGATLSINMDDRFGGTESTRYIYFLIDPDGRTTSNTQGPGKSIAIDLYTSGRVNTGVERQVGDLTNHGGGDNVWGADAKPEWFSW